MSRSYALRTGFLVAAIVGMACESSTDPGGNADPGSISLSLSVSALSVAQGANGTVQATVGRSGNFNGAVAIAIEGLPANVTAAASPASLATGATTSVITFTAAAGASPGASSLTVRASGGGVADRTVTIALTVTAQQQGGYTVALNPAALNFQQGGQASATATLTRTGNFAGTVDFSATGAPNGMTVTFNPSSTAGNTTTITLTASAAVAAATYPITIRASATGVAAQSATLNVAIATATGGNVTYRICGFIPVFAAYQDGNGPWTAVPITNNSVTFSLASGRGGIAWVSNLSATWHAATFLYGSRAELNTGAAPCPVLAMKSITGSVAGLGAAEIAYVSMGGGQGMATPSALSFILSSVSNVPTDLVATRLLQTGGAGAFTQVANRAIIRRGINAAAISTVGVLDFNSAEGVAPVMRNLTVNNLGGDVLTVSETYSTSPTGGFANSVAASLYLESPGSTSNTRQFPTLPAPQAGDLHGLVLNATATPGSATTSRTIFANFTAGADQTLAFSPPIGAVTIGTAATTPSVRFRAQYAIQPEYDKAIFLNYAQPAGGTTRTAAIIMMTGYLAGLNTFDHTIPDLNALTGWNAGWGFVSGAEMQWSLAASSFPTGSIIDGTTFTVATRIGAITP